MFGLGIVKGLSLTLRHFFETFVDDLKYFPKKSVVNEEAFASRQGPAGRGLFTVEYPEMKLKTPENFRFLPFLVTDYELPPDSPNFDKAEWLKLNRCTSCGICSKVCPPQCIWIVRTNDPKTGKPVPQPAEFYIDTDVCMNCGYCAEFCPFDAIKMDHDFELADYERMEAHIHDLERLLKPASYYASIRPTWNAQEEAARQAAEEEKKRKAEEKKRKAAEKAAAKAKAAEAKAGEPKPAAKPKRSPEEIKAQREAMLAKKKQRAEEPEASAPAEKAEPTPAVAQAETAAPAKESVPATPDDLTKIEGIGPKISSLLQSAGIPTFAQLAATEVSRLEQLLQEANLRLSDPATWPEQARLAGEGKWEELEALQGQLKGGRRV